MPLVQEVQREAARIQTEVRGPTTNENDHSLSPAPYVSPSETSSLRGLPSRHPRRIRIRRSVSRSGRRHLRASRRHGRSAPHCGTSAFPSAPPITMRSFPCEGQAGFVFGGSGGEEGTLQRVRADQVAGNAIIATVTRHYIVRTSWVIGEGHNFVRTMASLADRRIESKVVDDRVGRLTLTVELAGGIHHLLSVDAEDGAYNLTGDGEPASWADIARRGCELAGNDPVRVTGMSTDDYFRIGHWPRDRR